MSQDLEFTFRLDSEYYQKEYLVSEALIRELHGSELSSVVPQFVLGPFGSAFKTDNYEDADESTSTRYRYVRGRDVKPFVLREDDNKYIPAEDFKRLEKFALQKDDILISVVGTLGNASMITEEELPAIFSNKSTVLRKTAVNSAFLLAYLNSDYGRKLLLRKTRGAIQLGLNLDDLKRLYVPSFSTKFQTQVADIVKASRGKSNQSKTIYRQAETDLLHHLGLPTQPPRPVLHEVAYNIKTLDESLGDSGRWDAERYQPKYDAIAERFSSHQPVQLQQIAALTKGTQARSEATDRSKGTLYASIKDCSANMITTTERTEEEGLVLLAPDGLALAITGATIGKVGLNLTGEPVAISGDLVGIKPHAAISPYYLLVVLASWPITELCRRDTTGATNGHLAVSDVSQYLIPMLPSAQQAAISAKVQRSFALRTESEALLHRAKQAVEVAIEQGEAAGLAWLQPA
jgi:hypothetical protein